MGGPAGMLSPESLPTVDSSKEGPESIGRSSLSSFKSKLDERRPKITVQTVPPAKQLIPKAAAKPTASTQNLTDAFTGLV
jgi:hypothetical protein